MADHKICAAFIRPHEKGYVNNINDSGGETKDGVTYKVWVSFFGDKCHDRFLAMSDEDWNLIFKKGYWDMALADQINSQKVANVIVDWVYNSGKFYPEKNVQHILNSIGIAHLIEDGSFGAATINAINSTDSVELFKRIIKEHSDFYCNIVTKTPSQIVFLKGWTRRIVDMIFY